MSSPAVIPLLEAKGLTKSYGGNTVLSEVGFRLGRGEIVGLIGENGAGKSTLLNILSGVVQPDAGEILREGVRLTPSDYRDASRHGILRVFQDSALVENLRVYENMFFGWEARFSTRLGLLNRAAMRRAARQALDRAGLQAIPTDLPVAGLSPGLRQSLDIARISAVSLLLGLDTPVILFDEPTTALDKTNEENFLDLLDRLRGHAGVLFISHRLSEILRTCDRIIVLKDGLKVADLPRDGLVEADLHNLMVGRDRGRNYYLEDRQAAVARQARLVARGLGLDGAFEPIDFSIAAGEVLGLAGTDGSGKRRLGQTIAGELSADRGALHLDDAPVAPGIPAAVRAGIAFVPGDRQNEGLITRETIINNFQLPSLHDLFSNKAGFLRRSEAEKRTNQYIDALEVKAANGIDARIGALSGGNQQKVLLAKWLVRNPKVLVLENPTQGVDTGAREAIYKAIRDAAADGVAVLLISDDLPELIGLSDQIIVLVDGRPVASFDAPPAAKPDEAEIVAAMIPAGTPNLAGKDHV